MRIKKTIAFFSVSVLCVFLLLPNYSVNASTVTTFSDTDIINAWRVTTSGHIYTPVSLTVSASITWDNSTSSGYKDVSRREIVAKALRARWASYPNATMSVNLLNIRGTSITLPNAGSYIYDPSYEVTGRYNSNSETYGNASTSSGYGVASFTVGSGGYQTNSTAQVDFTW